MPTFMTDITTIDPNPYLAHGIPGFVALIVVMFLGFMSTVVGGILWAERSRVHIQAQAQEERDKLMLEAFDRTAGAMDRLGDRVDHLADRLACHLQADAMMVRSEKSTKDNG